jgi:hypothetical protein
VCGLVLAFCGLNALLFILNIFFVRSSFDEVSLNIHADPHEINLLAHSSKLVIGFVALRVKERKIRDTASLLNENIELWLLGVECVPSFELINRA